MLFFFKWFHEIVSSIFWKYQLCWYIYLQENLSILKETEYCETSIYSERQRGKRTFRLIRWKVIDRLIGEEKRKRKKKRACNSECKPTNGMIGVSRNSIRSKKNFFVSETMYKMLDMSTIVYSIQADCSASFNSASQIHRTHSIAASCVQCSTSFYLSVTAKQESLFLFSFKWSKYFERNDSFLYSCISCRATSDNSPLLCEMPFPSTS